MNPGPARVLDALRAAGGGILSGETLSTRLQVSRAQVWKHVEALRSRGYEIEGEPGGGYRLRRIPDLLFPEELLPALETQWLARDCHYLESTDSTNRVAFDLARGGASHGTTVIAEAQSAGRGRLGRSFFSPPRVNLYTSIVLRPDLTVLAAPTLILASAVAVAEAVAASVHDPAAVTIKWPNDVQLAGLKTAGILMELQAEAARVEFVVLGIGVNLNVDPEQFPADFRRRATSLAAFEGAPVDRMAFARRLYGTLEEVMNRFAEGGFEPLRPRFEDRFRMPGQHVVVGEAGGEESVAGVVEGIDSDGALLLRTRDDRALRVVAGDVTLAEPRGA